MQLTDIHPKLPMRNKAKTLAFYTQKLGFSTVGSTDYPDYLMLCKDQIEIHFFAFADLNPSENYAQVYIRVQDIDALYQLWIAQGIAIHPNGALSVKPWGVKEFALLDDDMNLLTFGEVLN
ncbi:VOC family protein [Flavobacterium sp. CYK-55]|uniref:bleomycin resistance protein n=1 Tax=Flavobacterium sp. CYK-55 TaxID=2835529 RepID=UPI001BD14462|nr:VOC family protein [Flavobacterium sp. CYK-55]MBS7788280.1 VOC family protein [Flavobacterium sp. CYK-55]